MPADARHMVVGRLRKPHGLKGDLTLFPITDAPDTVFARRERRMGAVTFRSPVRGSWGR